MRYFLELSYNGKAYHGWQIQPNAISVQEVLEDALSKLLSSEISIVGAGRTDSGVHASQMFAHFDFERSIDTENLVYKLNSFLPKDIAIADIFEVNSEAHARFSATKRTYNYRIAIKKNVFTSTLAYYTQLPLDVEKMNAASKILLEYNDFQCFSKSNTDVKTYYCKIEEAYWEQKGDELVFTIAADRFLRNMVRAIVGTLVNIGLNKLQVEDMHHIIESKDRGKAGFSVPAHGLYLVEVNYPKTIRTL